MKFQYLLILITFVTTSAYAAGRQPAVEDFVGIEIDEVTHTPQGTEGLFNFEKDINTFEKQTAKTPKQHWVATPSTSVSSYVGFAFLLGLPALSLFLVMSRFRQKAHIESASNIEVLAKYRKEREDRKSQEDIKKAS